MLLIWAAMTIAIARTTADVPRVARVAEEVVDVLDEPDDSAFSTGRLARGRKVVIRREGPDGWVAIAPPEGAFNLVEGSDLEDLGDGRARVIVRYATVRPGRAGAKMPGPPRLTLRQETIVRLLDRRPLVIRRGGDRESWVAIAPPKSEVRFVREDSLEEGPEGVDESLDPPRRDSLVSGQVEISEAPERPAPARLPIGPVDPDLASTGSEADLAGLSEDFRRSIAAIAAIHARALRAPIEGWDLTRVISEYEAVGRRGLDTDERRVVDSRMQRVRRQQKAAAAAKRLSDLVQQSKARDRDGRPAGPGPVSPITDPIDSGDYDATGLLQSSSRMHDGRKLFALLGDDGRVVAYLSMPLGLQVAPFVSRRVGVRGDGRFDEGLRARIIRVRDLERLGARP